MKGKPHVSPGQSVTAPLSSAARGSVQPWKTSPEGAALPSRECRPFRAKKAAKGAPSRTCPHAISPRLEATPSVADRSVDQNASSEQILRIRWLGDLQEDGFEPVIARAGWLAFVGEASRKLSALLQNHRTSKVAASAIWVSWQKRRVKNGHAWQLSLGLPHTVGLQSGKAVPKAVGGD